jgi:molecular chaperone DnaK (HSP70)
VFDFGGGTLDTSVLKINTSEDGKQSFTVLGTSGNNHLGGEDIDNILLDEMLEIVKKEKVDLRSIDDEKAKRAIVCLKLECEKAKISLSTMKSAVIHIDNLYDGYEFRHKLTRAAFEAYTDEIWEKFDAPIDKALKFAGIEATDVTDVILVGGSSKIPKVYEKLTEKFGKTPTAKVNPDEAVALGAAYRGYLEDFERHKTDTGSISSDTLVPFSEKHSDHPKAPKVNLKEKTSLSIGILSKNGDMKVFIPRSTPLPHSIERKITTTKDNQKTASIVLYEGEEEKAKDNTKIGSFKVLGLPKRKKGEVIISLNISVNTEGLLSCTATVQESDMKPVKYEVKMNQGDDDEENSQWTDKYLNLLQRITDNTSDKKIKDEVELEMEWALERKEENETPKLIKEIKNRMEKMKIKYRDLLL